LPVVLDACAIIAFLRDECGAGVVKDALLSAECLAHAVNLCEIYRDCLGRGETPDIADEMMRDLEAIGLVSREDMDMAFWKRVAEIKADVKRVSYMDCFALATAERLDGVLYSSDHHEFDKVADKGEFAIRFIR
jgi:PIN domain nuclease of toxin-antitoxin system